MAGPWEQYQAAEQGPWSAYAKAAPEKGNMYTQSAEDIVYSPDGIPLTTSSYGSEATGKTALARDVMTGATSLPVSYAAGVAKVPAGVAQFAGRLMGSNKGDVPLDAINALQSGMEQSGSGTLNKVANFAGEVTPWLAAGGMSNMADKMTMLPSYARKIAGNIGQGMVMGAVSPEQTGLSQDEYNQAKGENIALSGALGGVLPAVAKKGSEWSGKLAAMLLGQTTGVGTEPIKQAFKSGVLGGQSEKQFAQHLREQVPKEEVLDIANKNLKNIKDALGAEYRSGMVDIKADKTQLNFGDIDQAYKTVRNDFAERKGVIIDEDIAKYLDKVKDKIDRWKKADAVDFHTPEGMDLLKRSIGQEMQKIPMNETDARKAVGQIYDSVRQTINTQAPVYSDVMKKYSQGADLVDELTRTFNLGRNANPDTAMRKVQSLMRNNVNTDYGNRLQLAEKLQSMGGNDLMAALSGQSLSSPVPRGLLGKGTELFALTHLLANPVGSIATMAAASPRVVGEGALLAGKAARPIYNLANSPKGEEARTLARLLAIKAAQQIKEE